MMLRKTTIVLSCVLLIGLSAKAQVFPNLGGQRAGISTLGFLKSDLSARSVGLSGASIALEPDAYTAFINPAGIPSLKGISFASGVRVIGAGMMQSSFAANLPTKNGHSFALSFNNLNSGAIEVRTEFQPEGTGEIIYVTNTSAGLTYAKELSDNFSFGLQLKYIYEQLAQYHNHTAAADLGFLYKTDVKDLKFAVVVQNFGGKSEVSGDTKPVEFGNAPTRLPDRYALPTVFRLGASFVPWEKDKQSVLVSAQLNHPNDNAENLRIGVEYSYMKMLFLRTGYALNVAGRNLPSFGVGLKSRIGYAPLRFNYSIEPNQYLGWQHVAGISLTFEKQPSRDEPSE